MTEKNESLLSTEEKKAEGKKHPVKRAFHPFKYFLLQTFRGHTGTEYSELLSRGLRSRKGVNRTYPWAYIRLFAMFFILYAVFLLIIRFTGNELFAPSVTLLASVMFNLPFLCLMFELYPQRDLSFITVLFALLIGGTAACVITQALFNLFPSPNLWMKAVYAGFFEELSKAAVTVLVIVISGKRSPLAGFLFGAAVGCGFSVVEDMGYIFVQANEMPVINLTTIINISVSRGFTAFCTHTLWTALIGWAYSHFNRHLYNVCSYLVLLSVCGLHICWDLPLGYVPNILVCAACVVVAVVACSLVLYFERKAVFRAAGIQKADENYYRQDKSSVSVRSYRYWKHWGHIALALGAFLMAVVSVIYCSIPFRETYGTETFKKPEDFVLFMQNNYEYKIDNNRAYNSHDTVRDIEKTKVDDVLIRVTQPVDVDGVTYYYSYNLAYDDVSAKYYYLLSDIYIYVRLDGKTERISKEDFYTKQTGKQYSFFRINRDVTGFNFMANGDITVFVYDANFVRDLGEPRYVALFATFASVFGVSLICYIGLAIKSRRVKKLCSTQAASSAQ